MPIRTATRMILLLALGLWASAATAATVVHVDLWDKGAAMAMGTDLAYPVAAAKLSQASMGMKLSRPSAPAGVVTFQVTNTSKDTVHEMIVMYMADPTKALPYITAENRVGIGLVERADRELVGDAQGSAPARYLSSVWWKCRMRLS